MGLYAACEWFAILGLLCYWVSQAWCANAPPTNEEKADSEGTVISPAHPETAQCTVAEGQQRLAAQLFLPSNISIFIIHRAL